jgi:hypothetical protein
MIADYNWDESKDRKKIEEILLNVALQKNIYLD